MSWNKFLECWVSILMLLWPIQFITAVATDTSKETQSKSLYKFYTINTGLIQAYNKRQQELYFPPLCYKISYVPNLAKPPTLCTLFYFGRSDFSSTPTPLKSVFFHAIVADSLSTTKALMYHLPIYVAISVPV